MPASLPFRSVALISSKVLSWVPARWHPTQPPFVTLRIPSWYRVWPALANAKEMLVDAVEKPVPAGTPMSVAVRVKE